MTIKQRRLIILLLLVLLAAAGFFIYYYASSIDNLDKEIKSITSSAACVDSFLSKTHDTTFENSRALREKHPYTKIETKKFLFSIETEEGFRINSDSEYWDEAALHKLYGELKKNKNGEEIYYLTEVNVLGDNELFYLGSHTGDEQVSNLSFNLPSLSPMFFVFKRTTGRINLYNGDTQKTIESMSMTLSHEYGHHYTEYYMLKKSDADYAKQRGLTPSQYRERDDEYGLLHHVYVSEIAASDYVQLMGSPTVVQTVDFYDIKQVLTGRQNSYELYSAAYNAFLQENLTIPLAFDVPGLKEYYYSFIDEKPAEEDRPEKEAINIRITQGSTGYELETGYRTFIHYILSWDMPYNEEGVVYTLVCFDTNNANTKDYYIHPIKTVYPNNSASAYIGEVTSSSATQVYTAYDSLAKGRKTFYVIVTFPDGYARLSTPLTYDFALQETVS